MPENDFDLTLAPETITEYANASDRNLTAPTLETNPTFRGGREPGLGSWTEVVKIHDTSLAAVKSDPTNKNKFNFVIVCSIQGPDGGGFATNAGRTHTEYLYIDKVGLSSPDNKISGGYKRRIACANGLLAACGVDLSTGVPSYRAWFEGENGVKPLVGQTVAAVVRKYRQTSGKSAGDTAVSIDGFAAIPAATHTS